MVKDKHKNLQVWHRREDMIPVTFELLVTWQSGAGKLDSFFLRKSMKNRGLMVGNP